MRCVPGLRPFDTSEFWAWGGTRFLRARTTYSNWSEKVDLLVEALPCVTVCMYDVRMLSGRLVMRGGLQTHATGRLRGGSSCESLLCAARGFGPSAPHSLEAISSDKCGSDCALRVLGRHPGPVIIGASDGTRTRDLLRDQAGVLTN